MIEARALTKRFGQTLALDSLSFAIEPGEIVGFLGPNGAGKTTTMRILSGFLPADSGTARVAEHDVETQSIEVRRRIGYLPESSPLYAEMKVYEYLGYIARMRGIARSDERSRVKSVAGKCGLLDVIHKDIAVLSKGYRQRVGLAQTLIHDPDVLILDEPTTGLDPNQIVEIRDLIRDLGRNRTVILSTHILSEVEATCDRVIIIAGGKVIASDTVERLVGEPGYGSHWLVGLRGDETDVRLFEAITGVTGVRAVGSDRDIMRFRIDGPSEERFGETIFAAVVEAGRSLVELRHETASLEKVFRELTQGEEER